VGAYTIPDDLLDGGSLWTSDLAFYNPNGSWDIENHGISPDIEVEQDPQAVREGHDPQLEKAVAAVLEELQKKSPREPATRPFLAIDKCVVTASAI